MQESFIARQPILGPDGDIHGYELLFRSSEATGQATFANEADAGAAVLANMLSNFGQEWLLGGKTAFINVAEMTLQSEFVELLDPLKTVFEITPATRVSDELLEKIHELRAEGFSFALDDCALDPAKAPLLSSCQYVKIDCQRTGMLGFLQEVSRVKQIPALSKAKIIAFKVETGDEKRGAAEAGSHFYQGYFFEKPETLKSKNLAPNAANLLQVLNLTRKQAHVSTIEDALKKDVATSLKLLRYINSAGFGLRCEISSFKHAVQLLGYEKLTRWVLLLLATSNKNAPPALAKAAISRGRFMEILGQDLLSKEDCDNLFVTGTFSFLDALLGVDMEAVLPSLGLPDEVNEALLNQSGQYYPFLMLAIGTERGLTSMQEDNAAMLGITPNTANKALFEATSWAEAFVS